MQRDAWKPWVTYTLIALNAAAFAFELVRGVNWLWPDGPSMLAVGADSAPLTLHGEPWRLVTSMFLHFGVIHIGMNMLALYQARGAERLVGRVGFAVVYVVTGLLGGVASLARSEPAVGAGASGAVFGVFGLYLGFLLARRRVIDPAIWSRSMRQMGYFIVINLVISLQAHIDLRAHAGGFVSGIVAGAWLVSGDNPAAKLVRRSAVIAAIGLALTAAAVFVLPTPAESASYAWLGETADVIEEFYTVDPAVIDTYNAALKRGKAGELSDAQLADVVERDVIAPLRKLRADVAAATVPDDQRALFAHLTAYLDAELAGYADLVAASRTTDTQVAATLAGKYKQERAAGDAAAKAFVDELDRLAAER